MLIPHFALTDLTMVPIATCMSVASAGGWRWKRIYRKILLMRMLRVMLRATGVLAAIRQSPEAKVIRHGLVRQKSMARRGTGDDSQL